MWRGLVNLSVTLGWEGEDREPQRKLATKTSRTDELRVLLRDFASVNLVEEQSGGWGGGFHGPPHAHSTYVCPYACNTYVCPYALIYIQPMHATHMKNTSNKIKRLNYVSVVGISIRAQVRLCYVQY